MVGCSLLSPRPDGAWHWVSAALVLVAVSALLLAVLVGRDGSTTPVDQALPGPVLLVPGYGGSTASLGPLASSLRSAGRDVTVVQLPDQALADLQGQADELAAVAARVLARTGAASVDVVGYSAGGGGGSALGAGG